jgi:hypothetical protein
MSSRDLLEYANFAALFLLTVNLFLVGRNGAYKRFGYLYAFIAVTALENAITTPLMFFRRYTGLDKATSYNLYFYTHWLMTGVETFLTIAIVYSVFRSAISPLPGLHRIGKVVFRWVTGVSVLMALAIAFGPHNFSSSNELIVAFASAIGRVEEGVSVLILCLLLFVCFAIKPLGLSYRSRVFGVALGLGVFATVSLVHTAWLSTAQAQSIYAPVYAYTTLGACVAFIVWGVYFALPEPERKIILLPTTSPYHFWNRLSEALGDNPGHVALSGIKPSPVEMKIMAEMGRVSRERESVAATEAHGVEHDELVDSIAAS